MQHFVDSGHSFAKIAIPYTIYLSLNLPEFYVWQSISVSMVDAPACDQDTYLLKLLFLARYYLSLNLLAILAISVVLQICFGKKEIDKTIYTQKTSP